MNYINIFIGSSFFLMKERRAICDIIRQLNDVYISLGVRIKLHIWEDFVIGFSGKNKQQEYIDEMVIPSEICIFIFSHRVGIYTKMELVAKLKHNKDAVYCYRLPYQGKYRDNVRQDLEALFCSYTDVATTDELCNDIKRIISEKLNKCIESPTHEWKEVNTMYFYTTIPDDLPKIQSEIGTAFIDISDLTFDDLGLYCQLHPRRRITLLDDTDHYIPILNDFLSHDDFKELNIGLQFTVDANHRLKRTTVFDMNNIYKSNTKVKDILDRYGVFTDKIKELGTLKWDIYKWVRSEQKKLATNNALRIETIRDNIVVNGKSMTPLSAVDESGFIKKIVSNISQKAKDISEAISSKKEDYIVQQMVNEQNKNKSKLSLMLEQRLNGWSCPIDIKDEKAKKSFAECLQLEKYIGLIISKPIEDEIEVMKLLLSWEAKEQNLADSNFISPYRLLSTQFYIVGIFDTFLGNKVEQLKEEDELYGRILDNAEKYNIKDVSIEMTRMNLANMYSRSDEYVKAKELYMLAIENLQRQWDDSVSMARSISYIMMHLFQLEIRHGTREDVLGTLSLFKDHISRLDVVNEKFLIDICMYITAQLRIIDIEDGSSYEVVEVAESYFNEVIEKMKMDTDAYEYDDVFVFLPNMIARYYIDHFSKMDEHDARGYFIKAESFLKTAISNCISSLGKTYAVSLFHLGELYDQLGFLYAKNRNTFKYACDVYDKSLLIKKRFFLLSKERAYETNIAHVLVNYAALELCIMQTNTPLTVKTSPMYHVSKALEIYKRYGDIAEAELGYYQALQLRGTIFYQMYKQNQQVILFYDSAVSDLLECWSWNKQHPDNSYRMIFIEYSGRILVEENFINQKEYDNVKAICESINQ